MPKLFFFVLTNQFILRRQHDLLIRGVWCLGSKAGTKIRKIEIEFHFSARVHKDILQSKLGNVFKIVVSVLGFKSLMDFIVRR